MDSQRYFTLEKKQLIIPRIQEYFENEIDQHIGNLDAEFLLDFMASLLGPHMYNAALKDAGQLLMEKLGDIEIALTELEKPDESEIQ